MTRDRAEVAVLGAGFAGALFARMLARLGRDVVLLERGRHPRFALGESSTPLANLCLERLADRYDLPDLRQLASYGRWRATHPELRCGLKRGFTFLRHRPGQPFMPGPGTRLLVAASPSDQVADTHWFREDVDHHFIRQAIAAGVDYRDRTTVRALTTGDRGWTLSGSGPDGPFRLAADFVVDATGAGRAVGRLLRVRSGLRKTATRSTLLFAHFAGVRPLEDVLGTSPPPGPYPDERAAVHHLLDEGWIYGLRFDHGTTSAGALLTPDGLASLGGTAVAADPTAGWNRLIRRYPSLQALFGGAETVTPIGIVPRVQHRLTDAAGDGWVLLPHAYAAVDPLFSTGIAWSLLAIERLARLFEPGPGTSTGLDRNALDRYADLLRREADQTDRLVAGAYLARGDFDLFAAHAMLYFASVSFAEVGQRLRGEVDPFAEGFLGVGDPGLESLGAASLRRLRRATSGGTRPPSAAERARYVEWVRRTIAPRNVTGLADPARGNLYPVDLETVVAGAPLLGMSRDEVVARLPRLRGEPALS